LVEVTFLGEEKKVPDEIVIRQSSKVVLPHRPYEWPAKSEGASDWRPVTVEDVQHYARLLAEHPEIPQHARVIASSNINRSCKGVQVYWMDDSSAYDDDNDMDML
jgi:hypothetical protein